MIQIHPDGTIEGKMSDHAHRVFIEMLRDGHLDGLGFLVGSMTEGS
jgi:hypothetical protein